MSYKSVVEAIDLPIELFLSFFVDRQSRLVILLCLLAMSANEEIARRSS